MFRVSCANNTHLASSAPESISENPRPAAVQKVGNLTNNISIIIIIIIIIVIVIIVVIIITA
jgi:heme/copper-type cytochrome/quinol oxidase subunit 2